jgi:hypothetical protein
VPAFWLMVGRSDRGDVTAARTFQAVLGRWRAGPPLVLVPHTAHTFAAWIPALPKLLTWLTARIEVPAAAVPVSGRVPAGGHGLAHGHLARR